MRDHTSLVPPLASDREHHVIFPHSPAQSDHPGQHSETLRLMIALCKDYMAYGANAQRIHEIMGKISSFLHLPVTFVITPQVIWISRDDCSESYIINVSGGLDHYKLQALDELVHSFLCGTISLSSLASRMALLKSITLSRQFITLQLLAFVGASASISALFLGGNWKSFWISGALGLLVASVAFFASAHPSFALASDFTSSAMVACVGAILSGKLNVCFLSVALAGIVWLLPGLGLSIAVIELAHARIHAGIVRLTLSMICATSIALGLSMGVRLAGMVVPLPDDALLKKCDNVVGPIHYPWLSFLFVLSFGILIKCHPRQWPLICLIPWVGFWTGYILMSAGFSGEVTTMLSCFWVGILSKTWAIVTEHPSSVVLVPATFLFLPGSVMVRGALHMFSLSDDAIKLWIQVLMTAVSITVGLALSHAFLAPVTQYFNRTRSHSTNRLETLSPWRKRLRDLTSVDINLTIDASGTKYFCYHAPLDSQQQSILNYIALENIRHQASQNSDQSDDFDSRSESHDSGRDSANFFQNLGVRVDTVTPANIPRREDSLTPDTSITSFTKGMSISPDQYEASVFIQNTQDGPPLLAPTPRKPQEIPLRDMTTKNEGNSKVRLGSDPASVEKSTVNILRRSSSATPRESVTPSPEHLLEILERKANQSHDGKSSNLKIDRKLKEDRKGSRSVNEIHADSSKKVENAPDIPVGLDPPSSKFVPSTPLWKDFLGQLSPTHTHPHPTHTHTQPHPPIPLSETQRPHPISSSQIRDPLSTSVTTSHSLTASALRVTKKKYMAVTTGEEMKKSLLDNDDEVEDDEKDYNTHPLDLNIEQEEKSVQHPIRQHIFSASTSNLPVESEPKSTTRVKRVLGHRELPKIEGFTASQVKSESKSPSSASMKEPQLLPQAEKQLQPPSPLILHED